MDYPQATVSIVIFVFSVFIGIPIWWNTTKVYRAYVPHQEISLTQRTSIKLKIDVDIFLDSKSDTSLIEEIRKKFERNKQVNVGLCQFELDLKVEINSGADDTHLKRYCEKLKRKERQKLLNYRFHVLQNSSVDNDVRYYCEDTLDTIFVSSYINGSDVSEQVISTLSLYLNMKESPSYCYSRHDSKQVKQYRNMPPAIGYRIVFTLAVADPSDYLPSWDIESAVENHFEPLLTKLAFLGPFNISSQVLYFVDFKEKPNKQNTEFYYSKTKLPLLMNEIQPRLNCYTSTNAALNFILYIPPKKYVPLYIKSKNSVQQTAFHSARWGGLQFFNPSNKSDTNKIAVPINNLIKNFMIQYLELMGIRTSDYSKIFHLNAIRQLSEWSRIRLMIVKTFEYLKECMSTLVSLSKLLGTIENIVISEEIGVLVSSSLDHYKQSMKYLEVGSIEEAVKFSKKAFESSEKAFYDSSLLALLYFPDDQKYAIYIPLFLPISLPIIGSVYRTVKWLKS